MLDSPREGRSSIPLVVGVELSLTLPSLALSSLPPFLYCRIFQLDWKGNPISRRSEISLA